MRPNASYTKITRFDNATLKTVPRRLFGADLAPDDMRGAAGDELLRDTGGQLQNAMESILEDLLAPMVEHIATVPADKQPSTACVIPATPMGGGHAVAIAAFAPMPDDVRRAWLAKHNAMRLMVSSFPGSGAPYSPREARRVATRGIGGLPGNVPRPLPKHIVSQSAQLFGDDAPVQGLHLLGGNSWCTAKCHAMHRGARLEFQTVPWVTTRVHSQDGIVLWNLVAHPGYPQGLVWLSFHCGDHQVPTGDIVNAWLAPFLFHASFQRAMRIACRYNELHEKLGDNARALMLDEDFAARVRAAEKTEAPGLSRQIRALRLLDRTGGLLMTDARFIMRPSEPAPSGMQL